jgi:hypothetical protein
MKGINKGLVVIGLIFFVLGMVSSGSAAPKAGSSTSATSTTVRIKRSADLRVDNIYADSCACDLPGVDAMYMRNITVYISATFSFTVNPADVIGTLKVTYFDLMKGRLDTKTVMVQAYTLRDSAGAIVMVHEPVLIKKSVGVTAEISPAGLVEVDSNPANNKKKITVCSVRLI